MISKYLSMIFGAGLLISCALIWYMNGTITDLNKEIGQLEVQLISCQASTDNLTLGIKRQNASIDEFNTILVKKNKDLAEIAEENNVLQNVMSKRLHEINKIKHNSCDETMDWMLQEAIDENTDTID